MCARFPATFTAEAIARWLVARVDAILLETWRPRYNVAPTDTHPILRVREGERVLVPARWGLVPRWARDASSASRHVNARAETAATTPAFRDAFERHRCVVPTSGFFEWTGPKRARRPIWYHAPDGGPSLLAGLFDHWKDPRTDAWLRSFSIITTPANDLVAPVHDRMPALLRLDQLEAWLRGTPDEAMTLLRPAPDDALVPVPISTRVSSTANDDPACLEPPAGDGPLFGRRA